MRHAHTVEQVREAEAALLARLPEGALMARAATGLAHALLDFLGGAYGRRVLLLVGPGDNGGDALFAGAALARRGCVVDALLLAERVHEAGLGALRRAGGRIGAPTIRPDVLVDGIVGIGGRPGLRADAVALLEEYAGVPVVAVDTPSGVDVDGGTLPEAHVRADLTVTFGTHKTCHLVDPAAAACGAVTLVDLGLDLPPAELEAPQSADVARLLPVPDQAAHKYTRGVVGLRTGAAYPGAGLLSVAGAGAGLAGMVRYVGPDSVAARIASAHPEVVLGRGRVQAWVVGCGGGETAAEELADAIADGVPVLVDADGLIHVTGPLGVPTVLTPHAGELARMLGRQRTWVEDHQLEAARIAATRFDAVVLLKGRRTLVAAPDDRIRVTTSGTPWLATAGAGDVLAGIIGSLLASGLEPLVAGSAGAWLHGAAATLASRGGPIVARDVAAMVPLAWRVLGS